MAGETGGAQTDVGGQLVPGMRRSAEDDPDGVPTVRNKLTLTPWLPPAQLPSSLPDFVGRAEELETLYGWVTGPGAAIPAQQSLLPPDRVVSVTGPVGTGRSALAVRLAHRLAPQFPDGRLYARLTGPRGETVAPGDVLESFLFALGESDVPQTVDARSQRLRELLGARRVLILLEDATGTPQLRSLLPQSPGSLLIVTTVAPLAGIGRAAAVRSCHLAELDPKAADRLLGSLAGGTRIACDPRAADELLSLCDYHPTAVRLAGAWLRARQRYAIADLTRRLRVQRMMLQRLEEPPQDIPVRACFALIHGELVPSAVRLLRLLALVPGREFGADAAAALADCGPDAAAVSLAELAELHLVEQGSAPGRYRFHELIRGYVQERLDTEERPGERRTARLRLLDRYIRLARAAEAAIAGRADEAEPDVRFTGPAEARAWLRTERPELMAAARIAAAAHLDAPTRHLVAVLARLLDRRAHWRDVFELHELALSCARRHHRPREEAVALLNLGNLHVLRSELEQALACYRSALEVCRALGDAAGEARAMVNLGNAYADLGDFHRAVDWYDRALLLRRTLADEDGQARVLVLLGRTRARMGRYEQALRDLRAALGVRRRLGDPAAAGHTNADIAEVLADGGRVREALLVYRDALESFRAAGDERAEAAAFLRTADLLDECGDAREARDRRRQALALLTDLGADAAAAEVRRILEE